MLKYDTIDIIINNSELRWYRAKGYKIPTHTVQLWANRQGKKEKNGKSVRVANGTKITVKISDLPPSSNKTVLLICSVCGAEYSTTFGAYKKKQADRCRLCQKRETKGDGTHGYWVKKLVSNNKNAKCDISGEDDKRFLVLHHLISRSLGGRNIVKNYVILSANYHLAFHLSLGGTGLPCTKEQYLAFKSQEEFKISQIV